MTGRGRRDIEHEQQALFFSWTNLRVGKYPELDSAYAVPNGSYKSKAQAGRFRAEGLKSGVPDICLPVARSHGSLYIEMKSPTNYPTPNQTLWANTLERQGMKVIRRCTSWQDAARHCLEYLGVEVTRREFPELYVD